MAKSKIAPAGPQEDIYDRIRTRTWSDYEVASLCMAQGFMGLAAEATKGRQPALTEWRRVYRAFMDAAMTGRLDYADSRERTRLKERVEQIRQAFALSDKKAGARKRGA